MKVEFSTFQKDKHGYYQSLSTANLYGNSPYHPDMRWTDADIALSVLADQIRADDRRIIESDRPSKSSSVIRSPANGKWYRNIALKAPTPCGGIQAEMVTVLLDDVYSGWPELLDSTKSVLRLPAPIEGNLSKKDLQVLYLYMHGVPRKQIANNQYVSLKAIEKRLTRIKDQLDVTDTHHSLHSCIYSLGLTEFLMAYFDWFNIQPTYQTHRSRDMPIQNLGTSSYFTTLNTSNKTRAQAHRKGKDGHQL